jgi:hypothetical protein
MCVEKWSIFFFLVNWGLFKEFFNLFFPAVIKKKKMHLPNFFKLNFFHLILHSYYCLT